MKSLLTLISLTLAGCNTAYVNPHDDKQDIQEAIDQTDADYQKDQQKALEQWDDKRPKDHICISCDNWGPCTGDAPCPH